jgi:hypothetical protein
VHSLVRTYNLDVVTDLFEGRRPKKSFAATVDIEVSPRKFSIEDTCGGISVKDAKDHVFLLGKAAPDPSHTGLGVFGIGMKRAIFKLGEIIKIESNTTTEDFVVDINVAKWRKQDGWNLEFTEVNKKKHATGGTKIAVTKLNDSASKYFALTTFESALKKRIATTYALFINAGLTIKVNGEKIEENLPEFAESESLKTVRKVAKKGDVDIMILAGLSPKKDTRPHGWYVFCNGSFSMRTGRNARDGGRFMFRNSIRSTTISSAWRSCEARMFAISRGRRQRKASSESRPYTNSPWPKCERRVVP